MGFFDQKIDRHGFSEKWDHPPVFIPAEKLTPMWVADTDFSTAPCILSAMQRRLSHPTFGYYRLDDRFYGAICHWFAKRHGITDLRPEEILYQSSTIGALITALSVFTEPQEPVLVHIPNYNGFTKALAGNDRPLLQTELCRDADGVYRLDLADMEEKIIANHLRCMIFCSPHNPTGRVWTREELTAVANLCERHGVSVIADEIWADYVYAPHRHIPFASVSEYARNHTISIYSPTKTFNLAGLVVAYAIIHNEAIRKPFLREANRSHYNEANPFSIEALIAAYEEGEEYLEELLCYLDENIRLVLDTLSAKLPALSAYHPDATYLLWISLAGTGRSEAENFARIYQTGLVPNLGSTYHGEGYLRLNIACPRAQVQEALDKLVLAMA